MNITINEEQKVNTLWRGIFPVWSNMNKSMIHHFPDQEIDKDLSSLNGRLVVQVVAIALCP